MSPPAPVYVPVPIETILRLGDRYGEDYASVIEHVLDDFLERTADEFGENESADQISNAFGNGYYWDQLFLPGGTALRTKYYHEWRIASVADGAIVYEGQKYTSPAKACNAMRGGTSNNAWRVMEIKRPRDINFKPAYKLR